MLHSTQKLFSYESRTLYKIHERKRALGLGALCGVFVQQITVSHDGDWYWSEFLTGGISWCEDWESKMLLLA